MPSAAAPAEHLPNVALNSPAMWADASRPPYWTQLPAEALKVAAVGVATKANPGSDRSITAERQKVGQRDACVYGEGGGR